MALPLPNGKTQFCDANGKPLASGLVYHYVPSTFTPKDTYQDLGGTIPNNNPVQLDAAGEATILGVGSYRQIVRDSLGNQVWDQATAAVDTVTLGVLPLAGGTMTGTLVVPSVQTTGGELITMLPTADAISTLASLNVQGTTSSTTKREFFASVGVVSNKRNGSGGGNASTVALYSGIEGQNGTGDIWAIRGVTLLDSASGSYNSAGLEIDVINNVADRGTALGGAGLAAPASYGVVLTGTGAKYATAAMLITGPGYGIWQRGIVIGSNCIGQVSFQDLSNAPISYEIQGAHTYGWDSRTATFSGSAIRLGNNQRITSRDAGNTTDWNIAVQSGGNLVIGDTGAVSIVLQNNTLPSADNAFTMGSSGFRWSAVWAANGAIQTSDPALKTDMVALSDMGANQISALVDGINPIHFRWKDGGDGQPGKRVHWGWSAENVAAAFGKAGIDFGGYIKAEDGTQHLRPDQLLPVLWQEVKELRQRLAALEARA